MDFFSLDYIAIHKSNTNFLASIKYNNDCIYFIPWTLVVHVAAQQKAEGSQECVRQLGGRS